MSQKGIITNIQKFSLDDGPGIRTTVFFKGCNLKCPWCHNPENIAFTKTLEFSAVTCTLCEKCRLVCPNNVHSFKNNQHLIDRTLCVACGTCVKNCPNQSLSIPYREITSEELLTEILKDKDFYNRSGGGVTFSGGEPLLQLDFLEEMIDLCNEAGISAAVDTAANVPFTSFERILDKTSLFLVDLKLASTSNHLEVIGVTNQLIIENIKLLTANKARVWIRIPILNKFHTPDEIEDLAFILRNAGPIERIDLLPYHRYGTNKYAALGLTYTLPDELPPTKELMLKYKTYFTDFCDNVNVSI